MHRKFCLALLFVALPLASFAQQQTAASGAAQAEQPAPEARVSFDALLAQVRELREAEGALARRRESAAQAELERQRELARQAVARRDAAERRSAELNARWDRNEARIGELGELLSQHQGNLGELFGVTRQVAGDAASVLQQSMLSVQYDAIGGETRVEFLRRLAGARALPSITELERMWYELHREMTDAGAVARFTTPVLQLDGSETPLEVVRVGPFTASTEGRYLGYLQSRERLTFLDGELGGRWADVGRRLEQAPPGGYVAAMADPARGALLGLYIERPGVLARIRNGEAVGFVIIAVGVLGVLVALFQYGYLAVTRRAVKRQLRQLETPRDDNPLGRVLLAKQANGHDSREVKELRLAEAVLRELPRLERFQSFLRLAVAAGPLLGLIGTVIGMIITFNAITASGSSDPKLMAHGIGQAMIATVLGLGIAIPLLFVNAGLAALSRGVTRILDEQSQALLADDADAVSGA